VTKHSSFAKRWDRIAEKRPARLSEGLEKSSPLEYLADERLAGSKLSDAAKTLGNRSQHATNLVAARQAPPKLQRLLSKQRCRLRCGRGSGLRLRMRERSGCRALMRAF
jgi:hypothetical protein